MSKPFISNLLRWGVVLYILSVPVQYPAVLPFISERIKLPELVGLSLIILFVLSLLLPDAKAITCKVFYLPDFFGLSLVAGSLMSALLCGMTFKSFLEVSGLLYLFLIYFIIRRIALAGNSSLVINSYILSATIAGFLGIAGFCVAMFSFNTPLAMGLLPYPYLGNLARVKALTTHPTMLANILVFGVILMLGVVYDSRKIRWFQSLSLAVMVASLFLTFSKSLANLACAILTMFIILYWHKIGKRIFLLSGLIALVIGFQVLTHFYFISHLNRGNMNTLVEKNLVSGDKLFEFNNLEVYPTSYWVIKKMEIDIFRDAMISGTGPGGYNGKVEDLQEKGVYQRGFVAFDPHSTYFGILVEQGIVGLIFFTAAMVVIVITTANICSAALTKQNGVYASVASAIIIMANEAMVTDILNFRQFWVILGIAAAIWISGKNDQINKTIDLK